jgi:hypothetical protein
MPKIPKLADTNFAVGFVLPVAATLLVASLLWPSLPQRLPPLAVIVGDSYEAGHAIALVVLTWTLAVVLTTTNHAQYQILEGYLPRVKWFEWMRRRKIKKYGAILSAYEKAHAAALPGAKDQAAHLERATALRRQLVCDFPYGMPQAILPTRFGNRVRAFEAYPLYVYGADGVSLWPRLVSVIPGDFMRTVDEPRAQVDCLVNLVFLACGLGAACLGEALLAVANEAGAGVRTIAARWIMLSGACFFVAYVSYRWASSRAIAWGEAVRAAFDCYLPTLATQLGYVLPSAADERSVFWNEITRRAVYQEPVTARWATRSPEVPSTVLAASAPAGGGGSVISFE